MDKKEQHIKTELVNQGWEQMQQLLDTEMPVKKRRRYAVIWWWAGVAIFILLMMIVYPSSHSSDTIPDKMERIVTEKKEKIRIAELSANSEKNNEPASSITSTPKKKSDNFDINSNKNPDRNPDNNLITEVNPLPKKQAAPVLKPSSESPVSSPLLSQGQGTGAFFDPVIEDIEEGRAEILVDSFSRFNADFLPDLPVLPLKKWTADKLVPLPTPTFISRTWRIGMYSQVSRQNNWSDLHYGAGLFLQTSTLKKWQWNIGLGIHQKNASRKQEISHAQDIVDISLPSTGANEDLEMDPAFGNSSNELNTSVVEKEVRQVHLVPHLHLYRSITPRFQAGAGVSANYLLDTFDKNLFSATEQDRSALVTTEITDVSTLPDWELAVEGILNYRLTTKWEVYAIYRHGLTAYQNDREIRKKRRELGVGLRYYLR